MSFELDPKLAADTESIGNLEVCSVLLMNDARYPWCILVPRIADVREWHHLESATQIQVWQEVAVTASAMESLYPCTKLNIGALGNVVQQLHIHVVCRRDDDAAWPGPVWGVGTAQPYLQRELTDQLSALRRTLSIDELHTPSPQA